MAIQTSATLRDAQANLLESTVGTAPLLQFFAGAPPANCAAADSGSILAQGTLPSDWLGASSAGVVAKAGTWNYTGQAAAGAGTAVGHYRIKNSAGSTCHLQGTVTVTGGGGDMTVNNVNVANAQAGSVATWTYAVGGA